MTIEIKDCMHLFAIDCPSCKTRCWVNNGNVDDLTVSDVMAVYCWKCKHECALCEEDEEEDYSVIIEPTYPNAVKAILRDTKQAAATLAESKEVKP